jgi:hypothetical protein
LPPLLPGLVAPADQATTCDRDYSQIFQQWADYAHYGLAAGGSFESGAPAWSTSGGARIVAGNEPFHVNSSSDSRSLFLPAGASATSAPICFGFTNWHLRFFAKGQPGAKVRVTVHVKSLLGLVSALDGGTFRVGGTWQPSAEISLLLTNLGGLLATDTISLRFTAVDGVAQIDDVYIDPWFNQ